MKQDLKKDVKDIMGDLECPKDFNCYKQGFENLCKAQDIGLESYLKCLETEQHNCSFSTPFGGAYFCNCPLRVYIAKNLRK